MKLNLTQEFKNEKGTIIGKTVQCVILESENPLRIKTDKEGNPIFLFHNFKDQSFTLKDFLVKYLTVEENVSTVKDEKITKYRLFQQIESAKETLELETKDITFLQSLIKLEPNPLLYGQAYDMLEGNNTTNL